MFSLRVPARLTDPTECHAWRMGLLLSAMSSTSTDPGSSESLISTVFHAIADDKSTRHDLLHSPMETIMHVTQIKEATDLCQSRRFLCFRTLGSKKLKSYPRASECKSPRIRLMSVMLSDCGGSSRRAFVPLSCIGFLIRVESHSVVAKVFDLPECNFLDDCDTHPRLWR